MKITMLQTAEQNERYATDIKLPPPGAAIRVNGQDATLLCAERVDDSTLRLTLDCPELDLSTYA